MLYNVTKQVIYSIKGVDVGCKVGNIVEKDLSLAITKYMYERAKELGLKLN
ncbi:hypothetical protein RDV78_04260 [Bacillota bacterium LX-D]|nr:hypothetical protein [Bacillota bacterium LX-D]